MEKPHPKAVFIGYWRNRHPDSKRYRVQVWQLPVKPYMLLVFENDEVRDKKMEAANDGDNDADDSNAGFN